LTENAIQELVAGALVGDALAEAPAHLEACRGGRGCWSRRSRCSARCRRCAGCPLTRCSIPSSSGRLGELDGGAEGARAIAEADAWLQSQGVGAPERLARIFMPEVA
jgi:hypothetical protein